MPLHYLAAKDAVVREAYRNGALTQEGVKRLLKVSGIRDVLVFGFGVMVCTTVVYYISSIVNAVSRR